jgi:predicted metal-dependent TIM-barrel fold hydrolase
MDASVSKAALLDAHLHPETLSDQDLETMQFFGVRAAIAVAHHAPRESTAKAVLAHFDNLVEVQLPRLERAGIRAYAALGIHPQQVPRRGLTEILAALPSYFGDGRVVALGETGLHLGTEAEEESLGEHLALARRLSLRVVLHTPKRDKEGITRRTLALVKQARIPAASVLVDHAGPRTLLPILECGHWAGLTVHPEELSGEKVVQLVGKTGGARLVLNSDSGDGASDIIGLPRAVSLLAKAKLSATLIRRLSFQNAASFFRLEA